MAPEPKPAAAILVSLLLLSSAAAATPDVSIRIDAAAAGPAANARLLGTNVQWVYGGDDMLMPGTLRFDPALLSLAQAMGPTVLRYPGGDQSDWYDWHQGVGPLAARRPNRQAGTHDSQIIYMGSAEVLSLTHTLGAEALFTVNVVHGTAADAAAWVRQTNVARLTSPAGAPLPRVTWWEIGNEPYFPSADGEHPRVCQVEPETYAARIDAFAAAMRSVDSTIKIGIALANDRQSGRQLISPGCRDFARRVASGVTARIDFISLHDAYLPYDPGPTPHTPRDEYAAAMASYRSVEADLNAMHELLAAYPSLRSLPFAITEYNASFSLDPRSPFVHAMAAPVGALYVADLLRALAGRDDILMANAWSMTANDHWGAIHAAQAQHPYGRPTYEVLRLVREALQGNRLRAAVTAPTFDAPGLGFSAAAHGLPCVTALATVATIPGVSPQSTSTVIRLFIVNKDLERAHTLTLDLARATVRRVHLSILDAADVFDASDQPGVMTRSESELEPSALAGFEVPRHSVALLTLRSI